MENTAAVSTGAEQRYRISWSQQKRIWCLFKIWGGRGRKMASPSCNLWERGRRPALRKMGSRWLVATRSPCENPSHGSAAGRHGLCGLWWWDLWLVPDIRILYLQDTLAITLTGQMRKTKPDKVHFHKVNSPCAVLSSIKLGCHSQTSHTHTPSSAIVRCGLHSRKPWISLRRVISHLVNVTFDSAIIWMEADQSLLPLHGTNNWQIKKVQRLQTLFTLSNTPKAPMINNAFLAALWFGPSGSTQRAGLRNNKTGLPVKYLRN